MNRAVFIIPYFGKLPYYISLWMYSASYCKNFDFWLITDDESVESISDNVSVIHYSFEKFVERVQRKFEFSLGLSTPRKLCDFKPTYGYIFEDEIKAYKYWGFCDVDVILGDLDSLVPLDEDYDKLYVHGHMTLIKNTPGMNRLFMQPVIGMESYKDVLSTSGNCVFDEPSDSLNINLIAKHYNVKYYFDYNIADINPFSFLFRISKYDYGCPYKKGRQTKLGPKNKMLFLWDKGILTKFELVNDRLVSEQIRYFHFQKRKLELSEDIVGAGRFIIIPNKVCRYEGEVTKEFVDTLVKDVFIYPQYFKLKWNNLKKRLNGK
ncbi:MAG: hypothetical protein IKP81_02200 [Paludibacteraceae bacterium]|nr:hypothetical protein [Paludibacteraceae bacterium]